MTGIKKLNMELFANKPFFNKQLLYTELSHQFDMQKSKF